MIYTSDQWRPTRIEHTAKSQRTSTGVTRVLTDAGWAYCKPLGNRQGPHVLACEWVCVRLAKWFELPTFDAAIITLPGEETFPLPPHKGEHYHAQPGPAFLTREASGRQWDGTTDDLRRITNRGDITRLVAFDTWVLNRDRHHPNRSVRKPNYSNVFLASMGRRRYRLIAMDHTHCFDNGQLDRRLARIDLVKDPEIYGRFPEFIEYLDLRASLAAAERLAAVTRDTVERIVAEVPREWSVDQQTRKAWVELIVQRAAFLVDFGNILAR